jgi:hypothetical protein
MTSTDNTSSISSKKKAKNRLTRFFKTPLKRSGDTNIQCKDNASKVKLIIRHQFPGVALVFPTHAYDDAKCRQSPVQRIDVGSTTQIGFKIKSSRGVPTGILMYELKSMRFNKNAIISEDKATCTQLYIAWEVNNSRGFCVYSSLIEHDKSQTWDRDRLMRLIHWYNLTSIQHGPIEMTYSIHDNTVLMTIVNMTYEEGCYKLEIEITKGSIKYNTQRPLYIDVDR